MFFGSPTIQIDVNGSKMEYIIIISWRLSMR